MELLTWIGFLVSIIALLVISRKSLPLALFVGGIILGFFTLPPYKVGIEILATVTDPSVILLALSMGIIPLIGGLMKRSGQIDYLVDNLRVGKKALLVISPAVMGMLPIPGGALLSAPVVEKGGKWVKRDVKVAINVWFRHLLVLIYPLSPALIASAKIAGLGVYEIIPYLLPGFVFAFLLGYVFLLKGIREKITYTEQFSLQKLLLPLCVILVAPFLDFTLQKVFKFPVKEIATLIGVSSSFLLSWGFSKVKINIGGLCQEMRPWNFILIIIGIFVFINIFRASGATELIASLTLSKTFLCIGVGFVLGIVTGRVQLPASILLPVYLITFGPISALIFSLMYISIFFGYVISPVHPCVSVSIEYFNIRFKEFFKITSIPVFIILVALFIISKIVL